MNFNTSGDSLMKIIDKIKVKTPEQELKMVLEAIEVSPRERL